MTSPHRVTSTLFTLILACSPTAPGGTETTRATAEPSTSDTDATSTSGDDSATVTSAPETTEAWTDTGMTSTSSPSTGDETSSTSDTSTGETTGGPACGPGDPLMPCKDDLTCNDGAFCVETVDGNFCSVPCNECDAAWPCAPNDPDLLCVEFDPDKLRTCAQHCEGDDECFNGSVCNEDIGACVWPVDPPDWCEAGEPMAPCKEDKTCDAGAFCVEGAEGNFCSVPCDKCHITAPVGKCSPNPSGIECAPVDTCISACESDADCTGEAVCDDGLGACVWPVDSSGCEIPGEYLGPCINGECNGDGVCTEGHDGMFCAPSCNVCAAGLRDCNGDLVKYTCNESELCIPKCDPANVGCDEGAAFEPCDAFWQCAPGLICVTLTKYPGDIGNVCMPECSQCEDPETIIAADNLGAMPPACSTDPGLCFVPCKSDADCNVDAACFDGTCGWKV